MRTLVVADEFAWPPVTGYRIRLDNVLRALVTLGPVDYLAVLNDNRPAELSSTPAEGRFERVRIVRSGESRRRATSVLRAVIGRHPRRVLWPDWTTARTILGEWEASRYDLVWCAHADSYAAVGDLLGDSVVVDLDNLEGTALRTRRMARALEQNRSVVRRRVAAAFDRIDEWRWNRLERHIARTVSATVVCSEIDRVRLSVPGVAVVPNGYEPSGDPASRDRTGKPLSLVFVGLYLYEPNRDAARELAREILPRIRVVEPDARLRLVGRADGMLDELGCVPGVELVGEVQDVAPELAQADIMVAPIRFGSGTRLKIIEAFAHRIPVVSSSLGAEGLDAVHDESIVLADSHEAFAAACLALHQDPRRAAALADAAHDLWERRYRWDSVHDAVIAVVETVVADHGGPTPTTAHEWPVPERDDRTT